MDIPAPAFYNIPTRFTVDYRVPKRRRSNSDSSNASNAANSEDEFFTPAPSIASSFISPGALAPGEAPPPESPKKRHSRPRLQRELLAAHNLVPLPTTANKTMRQRNISVVTAILHRSLSDRNYAQAERAYGCLIRSKEIDICRIWGIGVQLLLHRSEDGHKIAAEFLEWLIVTFPYSQRLHGYHPALGKQRKDGKTTKWNKRDMAVDFMPELYSVMIQGGERPEKIREKLEALMLQPPWGDIHGLILLKGMVFLWSADCEEDEKAARRFRREARKCFKSLRDKGGDIPEGLEEAARAGEGEGDGGDDDW
ncbi:RNA polymerase I-specific initiation factor-domain-containing protein [Pyronema domesticum]|uniref:Similar to RNA polymerase I-specific transcription initiation factor rrn11 acc. no. O94332 n=1 Tax=Pyronema omphalodes (strain CBS 100304) TaxID=1076935 RepID=U4LJA4_PYROM|nr:RNA polymerase I-specific initiation factor-domain-containing protein [Pyronema domesticum]CCX12533.1 Similar to RNA polymerase I-specific transcription initiation factor rrn11; acc. no. O94332 [Pyronema omphalodes CBS 100304]